MKRTLTGLTRRDLIRRFGFLGFALTPIARAMGYIAGGSFVDAPRFVMFFKGGSLHPASTNPASLTNLAGTPLAPLQSFASDMVLFKNMSIHGGSPKSDGYQEEHGAGLYGCVTGNSIRYSRNDSYFAYTDFESIDVAIANHYRTVPRLASLPFASLHLGAGAHSDADNVGLGQRFISFRNRQAGDSQYGNAIAPVQNAGQLYDSLVQRLNLICAMNSTQPNSEVERQRIALKRKQTITAFRLSDVRSAQQSLGLDSEHAHKLDGLLEGWREVETVTAAQLAAVDSNAGNPGTAPPCPTTTRPTGDGTNKLNCDVLSPVQDQMISLIKLAFEWDLTRVVSFTLSGASSGQSLPSKGVAQAHHSLEHSNNVAALNTMGTYYCEKFAGLLGALKSIDDGNGQNGLFNSSVLMGMECWSNSSSGHFLTNIPFVLAGQGAGKFQTGRIVNAQGRSNNDLLLSLLRASGKTVSSFGLASLCTGPIV
jgi:Protein of unknown function (DUF1552)